MGQPTRLRIAYFLEGMPASGVETSATLTAHALAKMGQYVTVFTPWAHEPVTADEESRVEYFHLPGMRLPSDQEVYWSMPVSMGVTAKFHGMHYDIIHVHTSTLVCVLAWQLSRLYGLPVVYTYHTMSKEYTHYYRRFMGPAEPWLDSAVEHYDRLICNRAAAVVAPSGKAAAYLAGLRIDPAVTIIPNGVDTHAFFPGRSDYLHDRFRLLDSERVLLFVGRLNQEKRPDAVLDLFRRVSVGRSDLHLVLAGAGPMEVALREQAARAGLATRVHFAGVAPYALMPEFYRSATLWLSASQSEVHPMAALEAITSGLPAVAIADEALRGVVEDGVNGYTRSRIDELAVAAGRLLDNDSLRAKMAAASLQISGRYSLDATAHHLTELYHEVRRRANLELAA